jgi:hypothetical protein
MGMRALEIWKIAANSFQALQDPLPDVSYIQ